MTTALAMAGALGVSPLLVAEMLPDIESAVMRGIKDISGSGSDD